MPYNSLISATDMAGLIPIEYTDEILQGTVEASAVLRLGRRLRDMPTSTRVMPVLSALPSHRPLPGPPGWNPGPATYSRHAQSASPPRCDGGRNLEP